MFNSKRERFINKQRLCILVTLVKCNKMTEIRSEAKIPLILKLKRAQQKEIAKAQDIIVSTMYNVFDYAVLHGGTSIWRCYGGNRFSEDVDVYIANDSKKIELFFNKLKEKGFIELKKKISETSIFSNFEFNRINVKFEALFKKVKGELKDYETADGNFIIIYTLSPETLIKEKVEAYLRRLKIRDLYDIFFLLKYVKDKSLVNRDLERLLKEFKHPIDETDIKVLIIQGIIPSINSMLNYIQGEIR